MSDRPTLLLEHHLKELKLPTFLREYGKIAAELVSNDASIDVKRLFQVFGRASG